jgi:hypothetical protein
LPSALRGKSAERNAGHCAETVTLRTTAQAAVATSLGTFTCI